MATLVDPPTSPSDTGVTSSVESPLNLNAWIEENRHLFKPPVSNRYVYDGRDFFVMVIMGPNARNDFHQVDSEEFSFSSRATSKCASRRRSHRRSPRARG
jgi:hypothetical protein